MASLNSASNSGLARLASPLGSCLGSALQLLRAADAVARVRHGIETFLRNLLAAVRAAAEGPRVDAGQGVNDLLEKLLLVFQETQGELFLEVVGAEVCRMDGH